MKFKEIPGQLATEIGYIFNYVPSCKGGYLFERMEGTEVLGKGPLVETPKQKKMAEERAGLERKLEDYKSNGKIPPRNLLDSYLALGALLESKRRDILGATPREKMFQVILARAIYKEGQKMGVYNAKTNVPKFLYYFSRNQLVYPETLEASDEQLQAERAVKEDIEKREGRTLKEILASPHSIKDLLQNVQEISQKYVTFSMG